jgi:hypothetical protein
MSAPRVHAADDGSFYIGPARGSLCGVAPWAMQSAPVIDPANPLARAVTCRRCLRLLAPPPPGATRGEG